MKKSEIRAAARRTEARNRGDSLASAVRQDGWINPYTGYGTSRDKLMASSFAPPYRIQDQELLALFNGSDIAAKIVETGPCEMMRNGYELECEGLDQSEISDLVAEGTRLQVDHLFEEAGLWGGLFGGSLIVLGAMDGGNMEEPLIPEKVKACKWLNQIDRRFIWADSYYSNPMEPNYGMPDVYSVAQSVTNYGVNQPGLYRVHESRCIRFDGAKTDVLTRAQLAGWTWSLMQRPYNVMRDFDTAFQSAGNLLSDASQGVFKLSGLINMIASGQKEAVQERMALVDMSRSSARAVLLDAENESFERTNTPFGSIPDMLDRFMMRLSAATPDNIPVTILFGRSAAGMNATGDSDFRMFYDKLGSRQVKELGPKLVKVYRLIGRYVCRGKDLSKLKINFRPMWQPSSKEQSEVELNTSQKDVAYITAGVLTPEEVALSRYGSGRFSAQTAIDVKQREADQEQERLFAGTGIKAPSKQEAPPGQDTLNAPPGEQQTQVAPYPQPGDQLAGLGSKPESPR